MIYKLIIIIAYLWIMIYTASYGFFEYREGNKYGTMGIALLCLAITVMTVGAII